MADPPFNANEIDAGKIKTDPRLTFGLPSVNRVTSTYTSTRLPTHGFTVAADMVTTGITSLGALLAQIAHCRIGYCPSITFS